MKLLKTLMALPILVASCAPVAAQETDNFKSLVESEFNGECLPILNNKFVLCGVEGPPVCTTLSMTVNPDQAATRNGFALSKRLGPTKGYYGDSVQYAFMKDANGPKAGDIIIHFYEGNQTVCAEFKNVGQAL